MYALFQDFGMPLHDFIIFVYGECIVLVRVHFFQKALEVKKQKQKKTSKFLYSIGHTVV